VITGVAWSGRGTITRVDVSLDGGKNWQQARIDGPSLTSRCTASTGHQLGWLAAAAAVARDRLRGYVQPTKDELRAARGENSIYHNNGIQTWHVKANGEVENVEVS
jgi:sulfane dehydrogenase subunit SoxC